MKFGRLRVIRFGGYRELKHGRRAQWLCQCRCGTKLLILHSNLVGGGSTSCGCLRIENTILATTKHGKKHLPEYRIWKSMKQRCTNPNALGYENYGGRGIVVCERWAESFEAFYNDMGLDRPQNILLNVKKMTETTNRTTVSGRHAALIIATHAQIIASSLPVKTYA